ERLLQAIDKLKEGEILMKADILIALKLNATSANEFNIQDLTAFKPFEYAEEINQVKYPEDIFKKNDEQIKVDFALITKGKTSAGLSATNTIIGEDVFVEEGVEAECSSFNTHLGPIYLGKNSQVWEGTHIRGS